MKNYCAYESRIFVISEEKDLKEINNKFAHLDIVAYKVTKIPKHLRRGKGDSAKLLFMRSRTGETFAKRFNNSQHFFIGF